MLIQCVGRRGPSPCAMPKPHPLACNKLVTGTLRQVRVQSHLNGNGTRRKVFFSPGSQTARPAAKLKPRLEATGKKNTTDQEFLQQMQGLTKLASELFNAIAGNKKRLMHLGSGVVELVSVINRCLQFTSKRVGDFLLDPAKSDHVERQYERRLSTRIDSFQGIKEPKDKPAKNFLITQGNSAIEGSFAGSLKDGVQGWMGVGVSISIGEMEGRAFHGGKFWTAANFRLGAAPYFSCYLRNQDKKYGILIDDFGIKVLIETQDPESPSQIENSLTIPWEELTSENIASLKRIHNHFIQAIQPDSHEEILEDENQSSSGFP